MRTLLGLVMVCAASVAMAQELPPGLHLVAEFQAPADTEQIFVIKTPSGARPFDWDMSSVAYDTADVCTTEWAWDTNELTMTCRIEIERDYYYRYGFCGRPVVGCSGTFFEPGHRKFMAVQPARPKASRLQRQK